MSPSKVTKETRPDGEAIVPMKGNKQYQAYRAHMTGLSWDEVAERVGYANGQVAQVEVHVYLTRSATQLEQQRRDEMLDMEFRRLDAIQAMFWEDMEAERDPKYAQVVLAVMKHRSVLMGWDGKDKNDSSKTMVVVQGTTEEYIKALESVDG